MVCLAYLLVQIDYFLTFCYYIAYFLLTNMICILIMLPKILKKKSKYLQKYKTESTQHWRYTKGGFNHRVQNGIMVFFVEASNHRITRIQKSKARIIMHASIFTYHSVLSKIKSRKGPSSVLHGPLLILFLHIIMVLFCGERFLGYPKIIFIIEYVYFDIIKQQNQVLSFELSLVFIIRDYILYKIKDKIINELH